LAQESIQRTIFPLGELKKTNVREMAIDAGYTDVANKPESYEICFVPDNDYRGFLKRKVDGLEQKVDGGNFVNAEGKLLGKHHGYPFYTIGQRKGLEVAFGHPMFVTEIIPESNTVVLGTKEELEQQQIVVRDFNLIKYEHLTTEMDFLTKIRYKDAGTMATVCHNENNLQVTFHGKVTGVAPGQSAVFYEGKDLVGGGFIMRKPKQ
jgi:tRNA-specific 2-thiouridylase